MSTVTAKDGVATAEAAGTSKAAEVKFDDPNDSAAESNPKPPQDGDKVFASSSFSKGDLDTSFDGTTSVASSWAPPPPPPRQQQQQQDGGASMSSMPSSSIKSPSRRRKGRKKSPKRKEGGEASLTERLGSSALNSTLEILRLAGGVTLSTTGAVLSPSLEMTRNVILPNLVGGILDYISHISPQRLKDWFRIVSASLHHLIAVIVSTENGSVFRHKIVRVGGDLVDVVTSGTSRQALMDGMACFIKLLEALHTPEFKAFLEQGSVLGCRVIDAIAMDKNKKLIHDVFDLVWSGLELANDPATTVAFAEVAAYLCHALEMEDAAIHAIAKQREEINQKAAQKRQERDQYQTATYRDSYLFRDPNATVEAVILSAFGVIQKSVEEAKLQQNGGEDGIPGSVVLGSDDDDEDGSDRPSRAVTPTPTSAEVAPKDATTSKSSTASEPAVDGYEDIMATTEDKAVSLESNDIDVNYIRRKITERSEATKKEHLTTRTSLVALDPKQLAPIKQFSAITDDVVDDGKKDIEELASLAKTPKSSNINKPLKFHRGEAGKIGNEKSPDSDVAPSELPDRSKPLKGETPASHFYRVLDQVLAEQRKRAAELVKKKTGTSVTSSAVENEEQKKEEEEVVAPSELKKQIQDHRSEKRSRKPKSNTGLPPVVEKWIDENEKLVCGVVIVSVVLVLIFCAFGFYGMYRFVSPKTRVVHVASGSANNNIMAADNEIRFPIVIPPGDRNNKNNEYVIRIVREVVHVDAKGKTLRGQRDHTEL